MHDNDKLQPTEDGVMHHDNDPSAGDVVGEAVGSLSGVAAGAAIGSIGGPIGTIIGAIAGAAGGWWTGRTVSEAASRFTSDHDTQYRESYEGRSDKLGDRSYDDVRPAYQIGHIASENPDYNGKSFETVETDLQKGWSNDLRAKHGDWATVRPYAEEAYSHNTSVSSREGTNRMHNSDENLSSRNSGMTDDSLVKDRDRDGHKVDDAARNTANSVIGAVDNVKDRIDGNPASKPGTDPTDSRF